jgi:putative ABC transport system permease protein
MNEELQFHVEQQTAANIAAGMRPDEARRQAVLQLGGLEGVKEGCREERRGFWVETLWTDVRYGLRVLRKNPGFTSVAVLTLALGIGANTSIFSVIEGVLLRPLPYRDPGHLVLLSDARDTEIGGFLYKDFESFKTQAQSFDDIAVYYRDSGFSRVRLASASDPEFVQGAFVSADFFSLLGNAPEFGRTFTPEEEMRQERVVVLSHGLWVRRFGGSRDAIGKSLQIDGVNSQIIGVMPATFQFPERDQQFWAPITTNPHWGDSSLTTNLDPRHNRYFYERWQAVGRLKPHVSLARAQEESDAILARINQADPDENRFSAIRLVPLRVNLNGSTRLALFVLFGAVSLVLLIACSNVANLVLAHAAGRAREIAVRSALGAGRGRLVRQLLTENTVLALLAGCLGLVFVPLGVRAFVVLAPAGIPRLEEARVDAGVLVFTLGVSLFCAMVFGLTPAWKISRSDPGESLKSGSRGANGSVGLTRMRGVLVAGEFALALVLLTGAGLLARSFLAAISVDPGFQPERLLAMNISPAVETPEGRNALYDAVLDRVRALAGVQSAGEVSGLFEFEKMNNNSLREIEGRAPEPKDQWTPLRWVSVRGDFFQAVGVPLLRGRYFTTQDGPDSPLVAIIDESMARRFWPGEDPFGKRFKGQDPRGHNDDWITVIGIVRDMRRSGPERRPFPHVFEPHTQAIAGDSTGDLVVRTGGDPHAVAAELRNAVRALDSAAIISRVTTMEEQLSEQLSPRRFQTWLLGLFSLIALVLASVGIFGVIHYSVAQRTHEIGIRMALGAQPGNVLRMVVGQGLVLAMIGIAGGIGAALLLTRLLSSLLFEIEPTDPATFVAVAALLIVVALVASYIPARRAMRMDPMAALRYE